MGWIDVIKDQFLDVIEYEDSSGKLIVNKFRRESGNNELKQGSKVIVREGQSAVFLRGGRLAEVLSPGTYSLTTENFPILSKLKAFPFLFTSPIIAELFFISTRLFADNKWATKNPVIKRDADFSMVRIRAYGKFTFQISDVAVFMREIFCVKGIVMTYDIIEFFSSIVIEAFSTAVGESQLPVLDLASEYRSLAEKVEKSVNQVSIPFGVQFTNILIENISLPDEVQKLIDEQSSLQLAKRDMNAYLQYQTAQAMRDSASQETGIAGLGIGFSLAHSLAQNVRNNVQLSDFGKEKVDRLRELKALLDEGILTQDEFEAAKKTILS